MSRGGFVKVSRKILDSDLIREPVTFTVFMYLILAASYRKDEYCGTEIKRGEVATSYPRIALATGITQRQARTAIGKLVRSGRVSVRKHSKFSVITLINYEKYQGMSDRRTAESQGDDIGEGREMSPLKEINNNKKINKSSCSDESSEIYGDGFDEEAVNETRLQRWSKGRRVMLSERQVEMLLEELTLDEFDFYVEKLDRFIGEKNASVKNHYGTILKWVKEDRGL